MRDLPLAKVLAFYTVADLGVLFLLIAGMVSSRTILDEMVFLVAGFSVIFVTGRWAARQMLRGLNAREKLLLAALAWPLGLLASLVPALIVEAVAGDLTLIEANLISEGETGVEAIRSLAIDFALSLPINFVGLSLGSQRERRLHSALEALQERQRALGQRDGGQGGNA